MSQQIDNDVTLCAKKTGGVFRCVTLLAELFVSNERLCGNRVNF